MSECLNACSEEQPDCQKTCLENSSDFIEYEECLENCPTCFEDCDPIPPPNKTAIRYEYRIFFWYTTAITIEPFDGSPDIMIDNVVNGGPPSTLIVPFPEDETLPNKPISYCYAYIFRVFYSDGSCCTSTDAECFVLG